MRPFPSPPFARDYIPSASVTSRVFLFYAARHTTDARELHASYFITVPDSRVASRTRLSGNPMSQVDRLSGNPISDLLHLSQHAAGATSRVASSSLISTACISSRSFLAFWQSLASTSLSFRRPSPSISLETHAIQKKQLVDIFLPSNLVSHRLAPTTAVIRRGGMARRC